jgi:hypothetical protein
VIAVLLTVEYYYSANRKPGLGCCLKFTLMRVCSDIKIFYDYVVSVGSSLDTHLTMYSYLKQILIVLWKKKLFCPLHEKSLSVLHWCWKMGRNTFLETTCQMPLHKIPSVSLRTILQSVVYSDNFHLVITCFSFEHNTALFMKCDATQSSINVLTFRRSLLPSYVGCTVEITDCFERS